jgi:hypothetical protein
MGERGGGGQYAANLGTEWSGTHATTQRRDFQVSKGRALRSKGKDFQAAKRGLQKGGWKHAPPCIYYANKRLCLGYK